MKLYSTRISTIMLICFLIIFLLVLAGCDAQSTVEPEDEPGNADDEEQSEIQEGEDEDETVDGDIVYATNPVGTGYYSIAAGQGALLTKMTDLGVIVQPTSGPEGIAEALKSGQAQLCVMNPTLLRNFWQDDESIKAVRSVQGGNVLRFAFVTHEKTGIKEMADLKGRKVTFDGLSASHKQIAEGLLKAYGIDPENDITPMKMSFATGGFEDLAEGRTDVVIASLAGSKMEELASKVDPLVISVSEEKALEAAEYVPYLMPAVVDEDLPGAPAGTPVVGFLSAIYTTKDMSEDIAYLITKTLIENYQELIPIAEDLKEWIPENALTQNVKFPYHEGAIKYYKEVGMWTEEMDSWQQEILKEFE